MKKYSCLLFFLCITIICCNQKKKTTFTPLTQKEVQELQPAEYNIMELIMRTPKEIESIFGKPNYINKHPKDCGTLNQCQEYHYKKNRITVLYENNIASWFEFDSLQSHYFEHLPAIFALPDKPADVEEFNYAWFEKYPGIKKIAFIQDGVNGMKVGYAVVEVQ